MIEFFLYMPPRNKETFSIKNVYQVQSWYKYVHAHLICFKGQWVAKIPEKVPIIVFLHGNGCDIESCSDYVKSLSLKCEFAFTIPEYSGYYVLNEQQFKDCMEESYISSERLLKHMYSYFSFLKNNHKNQPIYIMGHSLGTGIGISIAAMDHDIQGLILISPYLSILSVVSTYAANLFPSFDLWKSYENVKQVRCPMISFVGSSDELIPPYHSMELFKMKKEENNTIILKAACHNSTITSPYLTIISTKLIDFIAKTMIKKL